MRTEERREQRYQRRKAKREAKKRMALKPYDDYERTFSYQNLYSAGKKIVLGVGWKASIQNYKVHFIVDVYRVYRRLMDRTYQSDPFYEFDLVERGKKRHIRSCTVRDRNVQRCLCDFSLVPAISRSLIYDNGASMKDKGYSFSVRRIEEHLRRYYREYGNKGFILMYDFSKFFDNVSHEVLRRIVNNTYTDEDMRRIIMHLISAFGDIGLGLGSQVSQVMALVSANRLDHFIKENLRIKGYGRYMDDGYLIHHDKAYLQHCLNEIQAVCDELGIVLNRKKTYISRIDKRFTFLKIRFFMTESGKIIRKIPKRSVVKMRRKLKSSRRFVDEGKMSMEDVRQSYQSWRAYAKQFNAYHTIQNMDALYKELFVAKGATA